MKLQKFIEKAIEGGCDKALLSNEYKALLLPQAWQAVGKVEGVRWESVDGELLWKMYVHRMIDALAEGKSIEEFFETL